MKKILLLFCFLLGSGFAFAKDLTIGDTLTLYFNDLFPIVYTSHSDIVLKYTDIGNKPGLRSALQRGIYYDMIANTNSALNPDTQMKDKVFATLLKKHFGIEITTDDSYLTSHDYEVFMKSIKLSFVYTLLQKLNTSPNIKSAATAIPPVSRLGLTKNYYVLNEVYSIIKDNHLDADTISDEALIYGAAEGIAASTGDEYTQYFPPESSHVFQQSLEGKIAGIGVLLDRDSKDVLMIKEVIKKSPAEKAGLQIQDKILKIDGVLVDTNNGIEDEILRLRGKEKTTVVLTVISGSQTKTVTITRAIISIPIVETQDLEKAQIITYREVAFGTDKILGEALQKFLASGKKRLILDLRDNPGGSMLETRNILNFFIDKGSPLVTLKYKTKQNTYSATMPQMTDWSRYEIIVLVNKNTASAAEVIVAVLREYMMSNLVVIGERTYGKGVVQELLSFDDNSLLKYTVAEWITPKKLSINKVGIKPDIVLSLDINAWKKNKIDTQLVAAEKYVFPKK
ncbi:MAG: S41 family peptidase [Candidatus Gracilibacteria bacterium]